MILYEPCCLLVILNSQCSSHLQHGPPADSADSVRHAPDEALPLCAHLRRVFHFTFDILHASMGRCAGEYFDSCGRLVDKHGAPIQEASSRQPPPSSSLPSSKAPCQSEDALRAAALSAAMSELGLAAYAPDPAKSPRVVLVCNIAMNDENVKIPRCGFNSCDGLESTPKHVG